MTKKYPNFYAPRSGQENIDARSLMKGWEEAKIAMRFPGIKEARMTLGLNQEQMAKLLDVSSRQIAFFEVKMREPSFAQRLLVVHAIDYARKKGYIRNNAEGYYYRPGK